MKPTLLATWGHDGPHCNFYRLIGEGPAGGPPRVDNAIVEYRTADALGDPVWMGCDDIGDLRAAFTTLAQHLHDGGLIKS